MSQKVCLIILYAVKEDLTLTSSSRVNPRTTYRTFDDTTRGFEFPQTPKSRLADTKFSDSEDQDIKCK